MPNLSARSYNILVLYHRSVVNLQDDLDYDDRRLFGSLLPFNALNELKTWMKLI